MMALEFLDKMTDDELHQIRARTDELLKARDADRKAKAVAGAKALKEKAEAEARALLASVGLSLKAVTPKRRKAAKTRRSGGETAPAKKRAG